MCGIKSYRCQGEGMILERGDTWTVQDNILRVRVGGEETAVGWKTGLERSRVARKISDNTDEPLHTEKKETSRSADSHLSGASPEVLLQHPKLDDVTGVPDHRQDGDGVAAPDVAVQPLGAVKAERAGHPQPRL